MNKYIVILLLAFSGSAIAESYVDGSKPFIAIKNANRQAEAWAICAASYDVISVILEPSQPARSKQMSEFSNGAVMAIGMSLVINDLDDEISPERFNALWTFSQMAMEEWPKSQLTGILADAETLGAEGTGEFTDKVIATVNICMNNLEAQQMYIDSWRELYKSGLLQGSED